VHGAVGVASRPGSPSAGRIFIDLADNPPFDHEHAVFGQVINGLDVVDRLLEGDIIERIDIIP
jgi:cyclophilin family peptidyl-prolyl cis-trans isomerase